MFHRSSCPQVYEFILRHSNTRKLSTQVTHFLTVNSHEFKISSATELYEVSSQALFVLIKMFEGI